MSIDSIRNQANIVLQELRANQFETWATELERMIDDLDVPERSEDALNELIGQCHIRVLGDLNIGTLSFRSDWMKALEHLGGACKAELRRQGKEDSESKWRREKGQAIERRKKEARMSRSHRSDALSRLLGRLPWPRLFR